jgi:predicted metal-dependent phosphoesterase TrpH
MKKYDLHTHTHYSDGVLSPIELLKKAEKLKLAGVAITDHDSIDGFCEIFKESKKHDIELIPGVEIQGLETEILGYFFNKEDNALNLLLEKHRTQRKKYVFKKIEGLSNYGIDIDYKEVLNKSGVGQNPNAYHIAKTIVEKGYAQDIDSAFKEYIRNIPVRLEVPPTRVKRIIQIIKDAGGKAVLPHPWYLKNFQKSELESFIIKLVQDGLSGIEVIGYIPEKFKNFKNNSFIDKIKELTKKYELIETAGSDFHGDNTHENNILGKYTTSQKTIDLLKK